MSLGNLLKIKWMIRTIPLARARELLTEVMQLDNTGPIRERLNSVLDEYGLGGLIRIGK
jgi:phosphotransferase system enzyme I (PtsP)